MARQYTYITILYLLHIEDQSLYLFFYKTLSDLTENSKIKFTELLNEIQTYDEQLTDQLFH